MLERTFIHIPGVGPKTEKAIWSRGIETWDEFIRYPDIIFSYPKDSYIRQQLMESKRHRYDIRFFRERLSSQDLWRVFGSFRQNAVYLDIETTGGYQGINDITVIGLYDGAQYYSFVNGKNLEDFESAISLYALVITFNGSSFDLPLIRKWFRHIDLPPAHIDLRFLLRRIGYRGGLKKIEKELGISRRPDITGLNGYDAVLLWKAHEWGDQKALERLIAYNKADVVNLEPLMELCYERMKAIVLTQKINTCLT